MYEALTDYIPYLQDYKTAFKGEPSFHQAAYDFVMKYHGFNLKTFRDVLDDNSIRWGEYRDVDYMSLDDVGLAALIFGAVRAEHMCEGILDEYVSDGTMIRWLQRLKELDEATST